MRPKQKAFQGITKLLSNNSIPPLARIGNILGGKLRQYTNEHALFSIFSYNMSLVTDIVCLVYIVLNHVI